MSFIERLQAQVDEDSEELCDRPLDALTMMLAQEARKRYIEILDMAVRANEIVSYELSEVTLTSDGVLDYDLSIVYPEHESDPNVGI